MLYADPNQPLSQIGLVAVRNELFNRGLSSDNVIQAVALYLLYPPSDYITEQFGDAVSLEIYQQITSNETYLREEVIFAYVDADNNAPTIFIDEGEDDEEFNLALEQYVDDEIDIEPPVVQNCPVTVLEFSRMVYAAAREAEDEINNRRFGIDQKPASNWCQGGWDGKQTNGMRLGEEKHARAEQLLRGKMNGKNLEDNLEYKIEATYLCGKNEETIYLGENAREANTIRPDVVVHRYNDPTFVDALFDFKFTCPPENEPRWGKNLGHTDYGGMSQFDLYQLILDPQEVGCYLVNPHHGIL